MAKADLTAQRLREFFVYDHAAGTLIRFKKSGNAAILGPCRHHIHKGYARLVVDRRLYKLHRLIWLLVNGAWPKESIDHIDGNPLNNRIENLRDVPHNINMQNRREKRTPKTSTLLGVYKRPSGFVAQIKVNDKNTYLGTFQTAEEAHEAYVTKKRELHPGGTL